MPAGARGEISADLAALAERRGLAGVPIMTIDEQELTDGRLPIEAVVPVGAFLESIGTDADERARIVRRSLAGAVSSCLEEARGALARSREELAAYAGALEGIERAVASCVRDVAASSSDDLLRGEISARIADVLGSWDVSRSLSRFVAGVRSRVVDAVRGRAAPEEQVRRDLTGGLAQHLADQYHRAWREAYRLTEPLVNSSLPDPDLDPGEADALGRAIAQEWAGEVTQIVRAQAESSRVTGRLLAGGINVVTLSLMVSVFAMTGGITGLEVGVAGASAALSQTVLESYFGERNVRSLALQARQLLERLARTSIEGVVAVLVERVDRSGDAVVLERLEAALDRAGEELA